MRKLGAQLKRLKHRCTYRHEFIIVSLHRQEANRFRDESEKWELERKNFPETGPPNENNRNHGRNCRKAQECSPRVLLLVSHHCPCQQRFDHFPKTEHLSQKHENSSWSRTSWKMSVKRFQTSPLRRAIFRGKTERSWPYSSKRKANKQSAQQ